MNAIREAATVLGVLGGMGPAATADFLAKLTSLNPAARDQDHVPSITCSFPDIPDRTAAILENGDSPLPAMLKSLALLERCEVDCIAIPCNTAHFWFDDLQKATAIPLIHIVDAVRQVLTDRDALRRPIGLLATTATIQAGVYSRRLAAQGIDVVIPSAVEQLAVMEIIRRIKAGRHTQSDTEALRRAIGNLQQRGAGAIVLGCTELPLVLPSDDPGLLDSTAALALECLRRRSRLR